MNRIGFAIVAAGLLAWASAQVRFSEAMINPPGSPDAGREFIELQSCQPNYPLTGLWLIGIDGESMFNPGNIHWAIDLSAYTTGSNGLILVRDDALNRCYLNLLQRRRWLSCPTVLPRLLWATIATRSLWSATFGGSRVTISMPTMMGSSTTRSGTRCWALLGGLTMRLLRVRWIRSTLRRWVDWRYQVHNADDLTGQLGNRM
jgi:hypothetical protein